MFLQRAARSGEKGFVNSFPRRTRPFRAHCIRRPGAPGVIVVRLHMEHATSGVLPSPVHTGRGRAKRIPVPESANLVTRAFIPTARSTTGSVPIKVRRRRPGKSKRKSNRPCTYSSTCPATDLCTEICRTDCRADYVANLSTVRSTVCSTVRSTVRSTVSQLTPALLLHMTYSNRLAWPQQWHTQTRCADGLLLLHIYSADYLYVCGARNEGFTPPSPLHPRSLCRCAQVRFTCG